MSGKKLFAVCIDGSKHSERAFEWYCKCAHREGYTVGLVHIHQLPSSLGGLYEDGPGLQVLVDESVTESKRIIKKYQELCKAKGITALTLCQTNQGSIGQTICNIAKANSAEAIIIGQRGLGIVRRTFLGSVSDYVLHHSHVPTIVIPTTKQ
ncbi:universal stress protein Sll1388-like [Hydractinia symbiolongicarpus]|uniref:universal stress protein Sll1388-like n=1 Tax=Hydractinia symbiolongicarpus TaxID=13093 RepID=UPI00254B786E|nr:universal stress protein Sll1388-like [Hydractinia symbiolongicarpus]